MRASSGIDGTDEGVALSDDAVGEGGGRHIPPLPWQSSASLFLVQRPEVVLEQAVDEDVTAADFAQENTFSSVVEETGVVPRDVAVAE